MTSTAQVVHDEPITHQIPVRFNDEQPDQQLLRIYRTRPSEDIYHYYVVTLLGTVTVKLQERRPFRPNLWINHLLVPGCPQGFVDSIVSTVLELHEGFNC